MPIDPHRQEVQSMTSPIRFLSLAVCLVALLATTPARADLKVRTSLSALAAGVHVLEKPSGNVSRAQGAVHPLGNPHYYLDPKALEVVADHLAEVFSRLDPSNASDYAANAKAFDERMEVSLAKWEKQMEPY